MEILLAEISAQTVLLSPDFDAIADGSRPVRVYCDARIYRIDSLVLRLSRSSPTATSDPLHASAALPVNQELGKALNCARF